MDRWYGLGLSYINLALLLAMLPVTYHWSQRAQSVTLQYPMDIVSLIRQVPTVVVQGGIAATNVPQPYLIREANGTPLIAIDTNNPPEYWDDKHITLLAVGQRGLRLYLPLVAKTIAYPIETPLAVTSDMLMEIAQFFIKYLWIAPWVVYPALVTSVTILLGIAAFAFALIAKPILSALGLIAGFCGLMRLFAVAMTPTLALASAAGSWEWPLPWWCFAATGLAYIAFGLWANMNEDEDADDAYSHA